jgi:hypothetical protein
MRNVVIRKLAFATMGLALIFSCIAGAKHFWRGQTMPLDKVTQTWGAELFDSKKFRDGDIAVRAKMASALLRSNPFKGKTPEEVRSELGNWDGYYFSDMFPAYIIQDGRTQSGGTWQIVFLLDRKQRVSEVIVHKNE